MLEDIPSLQAANEAVDKEPGEQTAHHVSAHNLESIHERYCTVLANLQEGHSSKANAFLLARCPPQHNQAFHRDRQVKDRRCQGE